MRILIDKPSDLAFLATDIYIYLQITPVRYMWSQFVFLNRSKNIYLPHHEFHLKKILSWFSHLSASRKQDRRAKTTPRVSHPSKLWHQSTLLVRSNQFIEIRNYRKTYDSANHSWKTSWWPLRLSFAIEDAMGFPMRTNITSQC